MKKLLFILLFLTSVFAQSQYDGWITWGDWNSDNENNVDSTLILWLEADQNITLNGSNISKWGDLSTYNNDVSQSNSASQPLYSNNPYYIETVNSGGSGYGDTLTLRESGDFNFGTSDWSISGMIYITGVAYNIYPYYRLNSSNMGIRVRYSGQTIYLSLISLFGDETSISSSSLSIGWHSFTVNGRNHPYLDMYIDGVLDNSVSSGDVAYSDVPDATLSICYAGNTDGARGKIAAFKVYRRNLTASEITALHNTWDAKYK